MAAKPTDRPARPEDRTADDEAKGRPIQGGEDIDGPGHDPEPVDPKGRATEGDTKRPKPPDRQRDRPPARDDG